MHVEMRLYEKSANFCDSIRAMAVSSSSGPQLITHGVHMLLHENF